MEFPGGGTSMSTPLIAGMQADAQQASHGLAIGFANPAIYARYGTPAYHDVTDDPHAAGGTAAVVSTVGVPGMNISPPVLVTFGHDLDLAATPGYDDVTGVGTPASAFFRPYWYR
jgi:subtilase family serine protease